MLPNLVHWPRCCSGGRLDGTNWHIIINSTRQAALRLSPLPVCVYGHFTPGNWREGVHAPQKQRLIFTATHAQPHASPVVDPASYADVHERSSGSPRSVEIFPCSHSFAVMRTQAQSLLPVEPPIDVFPSTAMGKSSGRSQLES